MTDPNVLYRNYGRGREQGAALGSLDRRLFEAYYGSWLPSRQARILDIGCGDGGLLEQLHDRGYTNLKGMDLSPSQVDRARARGLTVELGDAAELLGASTEVYDAIFLVDVVEHIQRQQLIPLLRLLQEHLSAGGVVIGQTPNGESPEVGTILWDDATHIWCYTPRALKQCFQAVGPWRVECIESVVPPVKPSWAIRWLYWQIKRRLMHLSRRLEHGGGGSGIYSRVFRFCARKSSID